MFCYQSEGLWNTKFKIRLFVFFWKESRTSSFLSDAVNDTDQYQFDSEDEGIAFEMGINKLTIFFV